MKCHVLFSMAALAIPFVNAGYFNGKSSTDSPKRSTKYLKFFKSSSQLLGSGSTTSARYINGPTSHYQSGPYAPVHHHYRYHSEPSDRSGTTMMTSASEKSPSRIIIVRQPSQTSSKKASPSTHSYSTSNSMPYVPQSSAAVPSIAYPGYGSPYPSYGYASHAMSPYGYQMPQMSAGGYPSQMAGHTASPYSSTTQFTHPQSPLVASMIAAAQRVTQGQPAYGGQYAASYMSPQYSPYGQAANPYYTPYGYSG